MTALYHEGVGHADNPPGRGSGRYEWGTGKNAYQHYKDLRTRVAAERQANEDYIDKNGKRYTGDTAIAKRMGLSTTEFRTVMAVASETVRSVERQKAIELREQGLSYDKIAAQLGYKNDSSIRALLNENVHQRKTEGVKTAEYIKSLVDKNGMYDVGSDAAIALGISQTKLAEAVARLRTQGYEVYGRGIKQVTNPGQQTNTKIICPPGTPYKDIYNKDIHFFGNEDTQLINNGTKIKKAFEYPVGIDPSRVMVRYAEDGGNKMDGVLEIRRGVEDCSLKNNEGVDSHYAQVRVLVGDSHFIKGMAVYSDGEGWPKGVDMVFNTVKPKGMPMMGDDKNNTVFKNIKDDPDNPFGALIKEHGGQSYYTDENGEQKLRVINKKSDEGDWNEWSKSLPSQFLSKQYQQTIDQQLSISIADRKAEFETIQSLTNPTVKRQQLMSFAEDCDSTADKLRAVGFPGQRYQVMLPLKTISDNEVFAPNFKNGSKVALVRFPHEGTFQIPTLKVNNNHPEGNKVITQQGKDAIGISAGTAEKMSGADFDGDTALVIPITGKVKIKSDPTLKDLIGYDAKTEYGPDSAYQREHGYEPYQHLSKDATQIEMGKISNLITDMIQHAAADDEVARAVKYANCVIDADKHDLDYKRCYREQRIKELKDAYQGHINPETGNYSTAASTLITRANSDYRVPKRQGAARINMPGKEWYDPTRPEGALIYKTAPDSKLYYEKSVKVKDPETGEYIKDPKTGKFVYEKTGKIETRYDKTTQMRMTDDARTLMSPLQSPSEKAYANYANVLKALANEARKEYVNTGTLKRNPTAALTYAKEVDSLEKKLKLSLANQPKEKQAQYIAGQRLKAITEVHHLDKKELKKKSDQLLKDARLQVGAKRHPIDITDREWEAIQSGAISDNKLTQILRYADKDVVRQRAMPRASKELTPAKIALLKAKLRTSSAEQVAKELGISVSSVYKYAKM